jgi:hypothetical protein
MGRKRSVSLAVTALATLGLIAGNVPISSADEPPPVEETKEVGRTPPRLSFVDGEVSFWRPGAEDWAPAQINTPLAPGDELYAGARANLELQLGARAYVRAGEETHLGFENQEPDFLQFKVTAGHASLDLRSVTAGHTVELDTPNAAFTIDRTGYYRVGVGNDSTTFITRRGGWASMVPAGGEAVGIAASEQVVIQGIDNPRVETYVAPEVDPWDRWNYARTDHLIDPVSARYLSPGMYGGEALDQYGTWRVVDPYGPVWVPLGVSAGWAPYSSGRWVWDPYYGWTWVDTAPWGWAPYHYGRWVYATGYWAWAPGPVVVAPVYAPALVAFFGGAHFGIGVGVPGVSWVALGWGEPCVPWWGGVGFRGRPWWGGWGGPRVVNNVVVNKTTIINVTDIRYHNIGVRHAVIGTPEDQFGRHLARHVHLAEGDVQHLEPVRGALPIKPVAASLVPRSGGHGLRPPPAVLSRGVVATRAPHDPAPVLRAEGLNVAPKLTAPAPRLVTAPHGPHAALVSPRPPFGQQGTAERRRPAEPPRFSSPRQAAPAEGSVGPHGAPAETGRAPAPGALERRAPAAHAPVARVGERQAPAEGAPPRVLERRAPAEAPVPRAAPPHAAAPRAAEAAQAPSHQPRRELPGEPANRLFRGQPQSQAPRIQSREQSGAAPRARPERAPRSEPQKPQ